MSAEKPKPKGPTEHERLAYVEWLGIPANQLPPDYYALLGLERFERDPELIRKAGEKRRTLLSRRAKEHPKLAQAISERLARAETCLLDERSRANYDAKLLHALAAEPPASDDRPADPNSRRVETDPRKTLLETQATLVELPGGVQPRRTMVEPRSDAMKHPQTISEAGHTFQPRATIAENAATPHQPANTLVEPADTLVGPAPTLVEPALLQVHRMARPMGGNTPAMMAPSDAAPFVPSGRRANKPPGRVAGRSLLHNLTLVCICLSSLAVSVAAVAYIVTQLLPQQPISRANVPGLGKATDPDPKTIRDTGTGAASNSQHHEDLRPNGAAEVPSSLTPPGPSSGGVTVDSNQPSKKEQAPPASPTTAPIVSDSDPAARPFASLVAKSDLPPREEDAPADLGAVGAGDVTTWRWQVAGQPSSGPQLSVGDPVVHMNRRRWPIACQASAEDRDEGAPVVAHLSVDEGRLKFGWESENAGLFRSQFLTFVLRVESGSEDHEIRLRQLKRVPPIPIRFAKTAEVLPVELPFDVPAENLQLEVTSIVNMPLLDEKPSASNVFPISVRVGEKKDVFLHDSDMLFAEIQLRVEDNRPQVYLRTKYKLAKQGVEKRAVLADVDQQIKAQAGSLAKLHREIQEAARELEELRDETLPNLIAIQNSYPINSPIRQKAETELANVRGRMDSRASKVDRLQKAIPQAVQLREHLVSLHGLLQKAEQQQPRLRFQVTQVVPGNADEEPESVLVSSHE